MTKKPWSDGEIGRLAGIVCVYTVGLLVTAGVCDLHGKVTIPIQVLILIYVMRAVIEMAAACCLLSDDDIESRLGAYSYSLKLGSPLLGFGVVAWIILAPAGPWPYVDAVVRLLTVLLPILVWAAVQAATPDTIEEPVPVSRPTYTFPTPAPMPYVPPPPPPPPPPRELTPEEKELARIDAESKEFNLPADLVEAEKDRARAEFGSRNGTH